MILGNMQPYFFPYLGYFDLINYADRWIVFDTVQYIYQGWMNRNRILHPRDGWQYISVPLKKHSHGTVIKDIEVVNAKDWRLRIIAKMQHYKKNSPYYNTVIELLHECLITDELSLSKLNVRCLKTICDYLDIRFEYVFFSEMRLELGPINGPGEWSLRIAEALGADEYVNPPGGIALFDPSLFESAEIKLTFRNMPPMEYVCNGYDYIPNLSIIDVLMWNSPIEIKKNLDEMKSRR